jgi:predicted ribosome quality control (RQC) complex YloA/Tae2 family protein
MEMEILGKTAAVTDASITNRTQDIEERISRAEDTIEDIDTTVKENTKSKSLLIQNIQEIQDTMKRPKLRMIGIEESEDP